MKIRMLMVCGLLLCLADPAALGAADVEQGGGSPIAGPQQGLITALTTLLIFAGLVAVLGKYAWGPIASGLKERESKIRRDIEEAEAARARAEATLNEYKQQLATAEEKIRQMMAAAAADAEKAAETIRLRGRQEAEEIKEKANREIEASRDAALREIYAQAAELSTGIAEKIIRRELRPDDQRALVEESLAQLQAVR